MLKAGWSKVDITPDEPVPMAGYAHFKERLFERVRDRVFVRAFAFEEGDVRVVLLDYDLLMVPEELYQDLTQRLADTGAHVIVHATHTHSSIGGFGEGFLVRRFAGVFRPWVPEHLAATGEKAARVAIDGMAPARCGCASSVLPGLNGNRRDPDGPRDEELTVLRTVRDNDDSLIVSYPAHPVIVGERDHHAMSADFPGEVVRLLERDFSFAAFVQGSLGGVDVLFPDDGSLTADRNLAMMAEPLVNAAGSMARSVETGDARLSFQSDEWDLPGPDSRPFFDDQVFLRALDYPLRLLLNSLIPARIRVGRVQGFRVGGFSMVGAQADLGISIGLTAKEHARQKGIDCPVSASQCDGYIGYLHRRADYRKTPPESHLGMARYENAMSFFGHDMGERVLQAMCKVIDGLGDDSR